MSALLFLFAAAAPAPAPAPAQTQVAVLARTVERGTVLTADDLEVQPREPGRTAGGLAAADVIGRETVRTLVAGATLRAGDTVAPRLVRRGEAVTVAWRAGGLAIVTAGRALSSAGAGEPVRIVAAATNRTLDAIVDGPNSVRVP